MENGNSLHSDKPWYRELHWQILIGLVLAFIFSLVIRQVVQIKPIEGVDGTGNTAVAMAQSKVHGSFDQASDRIPVLSELSTWRTPFQFAGQLFIRLLMLIIIPLILTSIMSAILNLGDAGELGQLGLRTVLYYVMTTVAAVTVGVIVVNILQPGKGLDVALGGAGAIEPTPLSEVFLNIVPENAFNAFASGDMLPTIFVAILAGLGLLVLDKDAQNLKNIIEEANDLILTITHWIMSVAPIGVAALFVDTLLDPALIDLVSFLSNLGVYMAAVLGALLIHATVVLPIILYVFTSHMPHDYARALLPALLTAFSTASSSATYPLTLECVKDRAGVSEKAADFVLPLGATINMDGTALYEAVAAIFIANAIGMELAFTDQLTIIFTASLAAIGAAGVPSAGLVTMVIVLETVGLPASGYGLVVAVDRILDMCRTCINVWGDSIGAAVIGDWLDVRHPGPVAQKAPG